MPLTKLSDVTAFADYKSELKTAAVKARASTLPFRYVAEFAFDAGKKPLLLIGKLPASLLDDMKAQAAAVKVKAQGLCRQNGDTLEFEVEKGAMKDSEIEKALSVAGIATAAKVVEALGNAAGAKARTLDSADLVRRLDALTARLAKLRATAPAAQVKVLDGLLARLKAHKGATGGVDSVTTQELLDQFEQGLVAVERKAAIDAAARLAQDEAALDGSGSEADKAREARLAAANKQVDDKTARAALPEPGKLTDAPAFAATLKLMQDFMRLTAEATAWHDREIKTQQDAEKKLPDAQAKVDAFNGKLAELETRIQGHEAEIQKQQRAIDGATAYTQGAKRKAEIELAKQQDAIAKLRAQIAKIRSGEAFQNLEKLTREANKHGSARHGAQTGVELQARRAATGGITPDQADNPHGVSGSRVDGAGAARATVKWNKATFHYETQPDGKRKIVNLQEVLKQLAEETSIAKTSKSSMFISHVLEKEAVERALAIVKAQCPWTEYLDGSTWKPLDTVTVVLGKPRKLAGWGYAVGRDIDAKKTLVDANQVIERFRDGKIDVDQMLEGLDVSFATAADGSVPLVKEARVTLQRMGNAWSSLTHFPSAGETVGWSLTGRTVRKSAKDAPVVAPACRE
jgi:hypothetical protein